MQKRFVEWNPGQPDLPWVIRSIRPRAALRVRNALCAFVGPGVPPRSADGDRGARSQDDIDDYALRVFRLGFKILSC